MAGEGFARELLIHLCIFLPLGLVAGRIWYRLMVGAGFGHREEDERGSGPHRTQGGRPVSRTCGIRSAASLLRKALFGWLGSKYLGEMRRRRTRDSGADPSRSAPPSGAR